ncbi:MAG: efflux RND transporter periplasmic adaptor subunit [Bacteroidales bacterium]
MIRKRQWSQVFTFLCALAVCACQQAPVQHPEAEYAMLTVKRSHQTLKSSYSAAIRGKQDIEIYPQVSGFITKMNVEEGDKVKKGTVLFVIDQVPFQAALQTAVANVEAAAAAVANAELSYSSKKELFAQHVVSEFDLKTSENMLLSAKAQFAQMKALELNARNNLSYTEVKSPSDGVVGILPYRIGALVSPSLPKPLTTISDNTSMYAYFSMNESQLLALTRTFGSKEEIIRSMPAVELMLNDRSVYEVPGKIETISGIIDRTTGTVNIRASFANEKGILYSGSSANVVLPVVRENVCVIPQIATFEIQDKVFVYKVIDGKATSFVVKVTPVNGGRDYIVTEGLSEGDVIVAEGVGLLREGTPVRMKSEKEA